MARRAGKHFPAKLERSISRSQSFEAHGRLALETEQPNDGLEKVAWLERVGGCPTPITKAAIQGS